VRQYGEMIVPTRRHLFCPINETKGSFFLTTGGAPYDCRWKAVTTEPFETMSAFTDPTLNSLMEQVKSELMRRDASPLLLGGSRYAKKACAFH
jgi:hypothetical protein